MNGFSELANFIWHVTDDILRGNIKQHEYGDVILPFVVLRRLDCVLQDSKEEVLKTYNKFKDKLPDTHQVLIEATKGLSFFDTSLYDIKWLSQDAKNLEINFNNYINGFSLNIHNILENFQIVKTIMKLAKNDLLFLLIKKFNNVDLHPDKVSNHDIGYIFEELLRKFSELSNETVGEHYIPHEVIRLIVNILFAEQKNDLKGKGIIRTVYDPAAGTGGMLITAKEHIQANINLM